MSDSLELIKKGIEVAKERRGWNPNQLRDLNGRWADEVGDAPASSRHPKNSFAGIRAAGKKARHSAKPAPGVGGRGDHAAAGSPGGKTVSSEPSDKDLKLLSNIDGRSLAMTEMGSVLRLQRAGLVESYFEAAVKKWRLTDAGKARK